MKGSFYSRKITLMSLLTSYHILPFKELRNGRAVCEHLKNVLEERRKYLYAECLSQKVPYDFLSKAQVLELSLSSQLPD